MGQYHLTVNLDKKEFLDPHQLGDGLKLLEQVGWSPGGVNDALHLLLAVSNGRGGGDASDDNAAIIGRWGGDRIAVVGDYAERGDLPDQFEAETIHGKCREDDSEYTDITPLVIPVMEQELELVYFGDGWGQRRRLNEVIEGWGYSHATSDGRVACINGKNYPIVPLLAEVKEIMAGRKFDGETMIPVDELNVEPV